MRTAAPTIKALVSQAEQIRVQNLQWALEKLPELSEKERKVVEDLSNKIIKGLLQAPIQGLKHELAAADPGEISSKLLGVENVNDAPPACHHPAWRAGQQAREGPSHEYEGAA